MSAAATSFPVTHPTGSYAVTVGTNLLPNLRQLAGITGDIALVSDSNVAPLYAAQIENVTVSITVPAGEQHKTLDTVRDIYDQLLAAGVDRKCTIVALGGGVVGDMAGFTAATYLRGVPFVQCPTSLLAMVDASVGGKTGVDMPQGKNLVGAFKQPTAVIADISTLQTLPREEFAAGMAEVIKHSLLDTRFDLKVRGTGQTDLGHSTVMRPVPRTSDDLQSLVSNAIQVKRDVVQEDPFEQGRRATLNLGHTFGHAIEQVSGYAVRHGEGVAMGLMLAANLSARLGYCAPSVQDEVEKLLVAHHLPTRVPSQFGTTDLYKAMWTDKKKAAGKLHFVLLHAIGDAFVTGDVEKTAVLQTINALKA